MAPPRARAPPAAWAAVCSLAPRDDIGMRVWALVGWGMGKGWVRVVDGNVRGSALSPSGPRVDAVTSAHTHTGGRTHTQGRDASTTRCAGGTHVVRLQGEFTPSVGRDTNREK